MKFEIGDRVKTLVTYQGINKRVINKVGTVVHFYEDDFTDIGVEFDDNIRGHDCEGHAKYGHGWYIMYKHLELEKVTNWKVRING